MRKSEADKLRDIAFILDEFFYEIYIKDHTLGYKVHWAANEIRNILMNSGFNGFIDAKYSKVEAKWELNKEDK